MVWYGIYIYIYLLEKLRPVLYMPSAALPNSQALSRVDNGM